MEDNGATRLVPVKKVTVTAMITQQIMSMIEDGTLKPGDKLPSQKYLAEKLNVSHPSLREAMAGLVMLGFIESRVGSGFFVKDRSSREAVDFSVVAGMIGSSEIESLLEARMFFEASTAALAAKRASKEDLDKINQFLDQIEEKARSGSLETKLSLCFHQMIADCCHNPVLSFIENTLLQFFEEYSNKIYDGQAIYKLDVESHRDIVDAISRNDPQKAYEMSVRHIRES